jgi:hypothetical protein
MITWGAFMMSEPDLASFGRGRLRKPPAYLATVRQDGTPRVHPVTPIVTSDALFVFMEPSSPKARDLRDRGWYALHNGVPDTQGSGGEFFLAGKGVEIQDAVTRTVAVAAAEYEPADRYVLFELRLTEARCNGYGDVELPPQRRWSLTGT